MILFAVITGALINFLWVYCFYKQDKHYKESLEDISAVFLLSTVSSAYVAERLFIPIAMESLFLFLIIFLYKRTAFTLRISPFNKINYLIGCK